MTDKDIDIDEFDFDDADILGKSQQNESASDAKEDAMDVEPPVAAERQPLDEDIGIIRPNVVHLRGVEQMNTGDVYSFVSSNCPQLRFELKWVDDNSINVEFQEAEDAKRALVALTSEAMFYEGHEYQPTDLRQGKIFADKPKSKLMVRMAMDIDKKVSRASEQSKYYLLHGKPSFEDERFRYYLPKSEEGNAAREYRYRELVDPKDDLFPEVANKRLHMSNERDMAPGVDGNELFAEKMKENDLVGLKSAFMAKNSGVDNRSDLASRLSGKRDRSKSPMSRKWRRGHVLETRNDLASRLSLGRRKEQDQDDQPISEKETKWVKGELLNERDSFAARLSLNKSADSRNNNRRGRKGRQRASDMF